MPFIGEDFKRALIDHAPALCLVVRLVIRQWVRVCGVTSFEFL
jgi:hypothetical protein